MQTIESLLMQYGESHVNHANKIIHWICVPVIVWTVVALLWALPFPAALQSNGAPVNWATIALVLAQVYYFRLSPRLGLGLLIYNLLMIWIVLKVEQWSPWPLWQVAAVAFIVAWIGQFIGHIFEGKRPSFFKDLQFLLIGPAWLMSFLYHRLGIKL